MKVKSSDNESNSSFHFSAYCRECQCDHRHLQRRRRTHGWNACWPQQGLCWIWLWSPRMGLLCQGVRRHLFVHVQGSCWQAYDQVSDIKQFELLRWCSFCSTAATKVSWWWLLCKLRLSPYMACNSHLSILWAQLYMSVQCITYILGSTSARMSCKTWLRYSYHNF